MSEHTTEPAAVRPVWRRSATGQPMVRDEDQPRCGGREFSVDEMFELMRQRKREMDEAKADEREAAETRAAARVSSSKKLSVDDEDEDKAAERFRNDRYAVKLLQQDTAAWGGGSADPGMLG